MLDEVTFLSITSLTQVTGTWLQAFVHTVLVEVKVGLLPKGCTAHVTLKLCQAFVHTANVFAEDEAS